MKTIKLTAIQMQFLQSACNLQLNCDAVYDTTSISDSEFEDENGYSKQNFKDEIQELWDNVRWL